MHYQSLCYAVVEYYNCMYELHHCQLMTMVMCLGFSNIQGSGASYARQTRMEA